VFESPCFVLDSRLQSGIAGPPKWDPCSRLGIYVGHSPSHAGSVALVLNPRTKHVSPQFHVVFDDTFSTVHYMEKCEVPPNWADLVKKSTEKVTDEDFDLARMLLFLNAEDRDIAMQKTNNNISGPLGGKDPSNVIPTGTLGGKDPSNVTPTKTLGGKDPCSSNAPIWTTTSTSK
jgi:hypothetical protein